MSELCLGPHPPALELRLLSFVGDSGPSVADLLHLCISPRLQARRSKEALNKRGLIRNAGIILVKGDELLLNLMEIPKKYQSQ